MKHASKESLWKRVEDARLQWLGIHDHFQEINEATASVTTHDGRYARSHALHIETIAVKSYLSALQDFLAAVAPGPQKAVEDAGITPREREVLALIASGNSSKQIAFTLGIGFKTVVCHRYRVQNKLKAHNTADLTRAALRMGLIEL